MTVGGRWLNDVSEAGFPATRNARNELPNLRTYAT